MLSKVMTKVIMMVLQTETTEDSKIQGSKKDVTSFIMAGAVVLAGARDGRSVV